ncbi:hypothetical protein D3C80_1806530 [compost metagenome]
MSLTIDVTKFIIPVNHCPFGAFIKIKHFSILRFYKNTSILIFQTPQTILFKLSDCIVFFWEITGLNYRPAIIINFMIKKVSKVSEYTELIGK